MTVACWIEGELQIFMSISDILSHHSQRTNLMADSSIPVQRRFADFDGKVTLNQVRELAEDTSLVRLQTFHQIEQKVWEMLNTELFAKRPDVNLRVFALDDNVRDLSFLKLLPNVRRLTIDCLHGSNIEAVAYLPQMESLGVGIFDLTDFSFLEQIDPEHLITLYLQATRSKSPQITEIKRFQNLKKLGLEGQQKGIGSIAHLHKLEELVLKSVTVPDLNFLTGLERLWSLDISLGGTKNLSALRGSSQIKHLELWRVLGLADLSPISEMMGLQNLFLQALNHVEELPDLSRLTALRRISLDAIKNLRGIDPLLSAPALEEFDHLSALGFTSEQYAPIIAKGALKRLNVGTGSQKQNHLIQVMATAAGISCGLRGSFTYY